MAANHPLCNIFTQVITAAFDVTNGMNSADAISDLISCHHVDDFVSSEAFDAIQTALMNIERQVHRPLSIKGFNEEQGICLSKNFSILD